MRVELTCESVPRLLRLGDDSRVRRFLVVVSRGGEEEEDRFLLLVASVTAAMELAEEEEDEEAISVSLDSLDSVNAGSGAL